MNRVAEPQEPESKIRTSFQLRHPAGVFFLLLLFVVALYLYARWNPPLQRSFINLLPLATALLFLLSATGFGSLFRRFIPASIGNLAALLTYAALGIGITGLFVFLIGIIGAITRWIFLTWNVIGLLLFIRVLLRYKPFEEQRIKWNGWNVTGAIIIGAFLTSTIPFVVAPEVTTDALEYHLLIPKIYIATGKIEYIPLLLESNYPSLAEYNFLPILKLSSEIVCKGFHFWMGILVLLLIGEIVKTVKPDAAHLLASAFFIAMPVTATIMGWSWNDLLFTFLVLMCLLYFVQYEIAESEPQRIRFLILAGIMAGLASWTKYTFMMFFAAMLLFYLIGIWRWKWSFRNFVFFVAPVVLIASFWVLKNWIFTGNPVYPFLNNIFQSAYWTAAADRYFKWTLTRYEIPEWHWYTYLIFPFLLTLKTRVIDVHTGVVPLVLSPFLFIRNERPINMLKTYVGCFLLVWLFIQTEARSLLSVFAVIFCVGSIGLQQMLRALPRLRVTTIALIFAAVFATFCITMISTYYLFNPVPYFIGRTSKAQYLSKYAASQETYNFLNKDPSARRVLLVGLHNPFYLNRQHFFSSCCDPPVAEVLTVNCQTPADVRSKLKSLGVTHVVWDEEEFERENLVKLYSWTPARRSMFEKFLSEYCHPVAQFDPDHIFQLND